MKKRNKKILFGILILLILIILFIALIPKQEEKTIKIGTILSLSGPAASYGSWSKNGLELAINEIEKNTGKKINLIIEDDNTDSKRAVSAAQKLININKVKIIIISTGSTSVLAVAPIAEKNKIILFSPVSSSPKISEAGDYIFRNRISGLSEAKKAAEFTVNKLNKNKISIIFENTDFGIDYKNIFKETAIGLNENILNEEKYNQGATDFRTNLIKLKEANPEVVYLVCVVNDCINILKQAEEINFKPIWVSTSGIENQKLVDSISENVLNNIYYINEYYTLDDITIKNFNDKYESIYKEKSNLYSSNSYDSIKIIYSAIESVDCNPDKIRDYLYDLKEYKGVNGILTFDGNGDVIKPLMIKTIKNGKFVKYVT